MRQLTRASEITDALQSLKIKAEEEMEWTVHLMPLHQFWLYKIDGETIGFLKEVPLMAEGKGMIHMVYVHPDHRGNGYGSDIVNLWSHRYDEVWIDIREKDGSREFFSQLDRDFKIVKLHLRWENHPDLDFSDQTLRPNPPYLEHTGEKV